MFSSQNLTVS